MYRLISHKDALIPKIKEGMNSIAAIVARTLGPGGLPILIERQGQALNGDPLGPIVTKDGVTVASNCFSPDPEEDVVIQAVKAICQKTNRVAGDGTTTAVVLGKAILDEAFNLIEKLDLNPQLVRTSIERASYKVLELLKEKAIPCTEYDMIQHVATISANGDQEIGRIIRSAFEKVGAEGVITVDEGFGKDHVLEVVSGYQFNRGAESLDRFFNNTEQTKFEAENVHVVIYDGKLVSPSDVIKPLQLLFEHYQAKMPPVLFIANEYSLEALQCLLMNRAEGSLSVCAVRSPHQTTVTTAMLDDLAVYVGGTRLGNGERNLQNITIEDIGIARRVVVDRYTTTVYDGEGSEEALFDRIDKLKAQRENAFSDYDRTLITDRIASLSGGIAKIGVGGSTELEVKEKYHRIEDAVNAARAAIEEGVVPGGGTTLLRISEKLDDSDLGESILKQALKAPFRQIMSNLGLFSDEQSEACIVSTETDVFEGNTGVYVDAVKSGVLDPVKVTRTAFINAISISSLLSTCGGSITFLRPSK